MYTFPHINKSEVRIYFTIIVDQAVDIRKLSLPEHAFQNLRMNARGMENKSQRQETSPLSRKAASPMFLMGEKTTLLGKIMDINDLELTDEVFKMPEFKISVLV